MRLSICIPIYNCCEFIGDALLSILPQTLNDIEVIVYDGGSTDRTPELMKDFCVLWPNLHYYRGDQRGGIDADMEKCVGYARGEYVWLFSGDDVMRMGSVDRVLNWISYGFDIYICKHTICKIDMTRPRYHPVFIDDVNISANFSDNQSRIAWFRNAATTEAFFSFMSGLVIRRDKWDSGQLSVKYDGSCWGHVARLFGLISSGLNVQYVSETWLDQRGDNDSFSDKGVVNRFRIAIDGYHQLSDEYFGCESEEGFHIRRVIRKEFGIAMFLYAKGVCNSNSEFESKALLDELVIKANKDHLLACFINKLLYKYVPASFLPPLRFVYQGLKYIKRYMSRVWVI